MTRAGQWIGAIAIVLAIAACSDNNTPSEQPAGAIPQSQLDALDKAKNVEDVLQQQADKTRAASNAE